MARPFSATSKKASSAGPEGFKRTSFPVEVMDVILSESHPSYKNTTEVSIGAIKGRRYDTEKGTPLENLSWYNPIDPTDLKIPLVGEAVLIAEAPNPGILSSKHARALYYTSTVGIFNSISNNAAPGVATTLAPNPFTSFTGNMSAKEESEVGEYAPAIFIPALIAFEGDRIIQGRWGNSIRFGNTSNGSEDPTFWNNSGNDGDPITIIANGIEETSGMTRSEILDDGSSNIILSSAQELNFETSNKLPIGYQKPNQYRASQIVISSNKIIINSMEDNVVISGKKGVSISTPEWKADFTEMMDILKGLLAEMKSQADGVSPFVTGVGPTGPNPASQVVLNLLKTRLDMLEQ